MQMNSGRNSNMNEPLGDDAGCSRVSHGAHDAKRRRDDVDGDSEDEALEATRFVKYYKLSPDELQAIERQALLKGTSPTIRCQLSRDCVKLPPFQSAAAYEAHYAQAHVNVCSDCGRVLPSYRLLDLHLMEVHDSFFKVLAEKQKAFECFVDGCKKKCRTPHTRKLHLIDRHGYPKDIDFDELIGYNKRSASTRSKHVTRRDMKFHDASLNPESTRMAKLKNKVTDPALDDLTKAMKRIQFGRSR